MGFARTCFNPGLFSFRGGGGFMMLLFWVFLVIAAVYLFKNINRDKDHNKRDKFSNQKYENYQEEYIDLSPEEIAKRRYANGEIDKEEFERIKNDLRK